MKKIFFLVFIVSFGVNPPLKSSSAIRTDSAEILIRGSIKDSESSEGIDNERII